MSKFWTILMILVAFLLVAPVIEADVLEGARGETLPDVLARVVR
jgi:hypothetical protein